MVIHKIVIVAIIINIEKDGQLLTTSNRGQEAEVARRQNYKLVCSAKKCKVRKQ